MSNEEKLQQIGAATIAYQAAKVELAHIDQKIDRVFSTYREAGQTMDRRGSAHEPKLVNGKLQLGWYNPNASAADLLNETDLTTLVTERDKARKCMEDAKKAMTDLGLINVG